MGQPTDPSDVEAYERRLNSVTVGGAQQLTKPIEIREYDPEWPALYAREEARIRSILGDRVVRIEHAGSTSVPALPAKPIIDIVVEVPDSADEEAYVPDLEQGGVTDLLTKILRQAAHRGPHSVGEARRFSIYERVSSCSLVREDVLSRLPFDVEYGVENIPERKAAVEVTRRVLAFAVISERDGQRRVVLNDDCRRSWLQEYACVRAWNAHAARAE